MRNAPPISNNTTPIAPSAPDSGGVNATGMFTHLAPRAIQCVVGVIFVLLVMNFYQWGELSLSAIGYPGQLDFGEGVVWRQAQMMAAGQGYAPIEASPYIVFHYPPVFYGVVITTAEMLGMSYLEAGRLVSTLSALGVAAILALFYAAAIRDETRDRLSQLSILFVFLVCFTMFPLTRWSFLMRVDLVAVLLGFAGAFLAFRFPHRRWAVLCSAVLCVAAVYTKQSNIAAPGAAFLILLAIRPLHAGIWLGTCLVTGLGVLAVMVLATHGEFLNHIVLYNINRFDFSRLKTVPLLMNLYFFFMALIFISTRQAVQRLFVSVGPSRPILPRIEALRAKITHSLPDRLLFFWCVYIVMTILPTLAYAKSGAGVNYFIDFSLAWVLGLTVLLPQFVNRLRALFAGQGPETPIDHVRLAVWPIAFLAQCFATQGIVSLDGLLTEEMTARREFVDCRIQQAEKPIISDDMVALLRNGKDVVWESAIFAELAATGGWDETVMIDRLIGQDFAFLLTEGQRGDAVFDARYSNGVAGAVDAGYPKKEQWGGYLFHLPADYAAPACDA